MSRTLTRIKLPPCLLNPTTERPYRRHDWMIVQGVLKEAGKRYSYHVICRRCGLRDPKPLYY